MMFLATILGKYGDNADAHICWARSQMRYILGSSTGAPAPEPPIHLTPQALDDCR
jgi:hypothetical protein